MTFLVEKTDPYATRSLTGVLTEEWRCETLEEMAARVDDLTGVGVDVVLWTSMRTAPTAVVRK